VKTGFAAAGGHPPEDARKRDAPAGSVPARRVLGLRVDATSYAHASDTMLELGATGGGMTCVSTVHMVMEAFDAPDYQRIVNAAELVTPDGMPLVWMLRALGIPGATRVYGPDLTLAVCEHAERRGVPVGFYGGAPDVLDALVERLSTRFPQLRIAFVHSPPFTLDTPRIDPASADAIRDSGIGVLFVGLGCPKQERFMAAHREQLPCALVGVGAAFDFLAGCKRQAPAWLQRLGLEWAFRLVCEPGRLWRRYLVHNPRFAVRALRQCWRERHAFRV
jgi:N-acetylglucosaminyldiphosphoundecaprenol N-acetyl-beta-D-mannosaminyltransferase